MKNRSDAATATIRPAGERDDNKGRFVIGGALGFDTVPDLMKQAERLFASVDGVVVDFSEVTSCNSAALAFVLEIARLMQKQSKPVCFESLPEQIRTFAKAYSVDKELAETGWLC